MGKGFVSINRIVLYFILIAGLLVTGPAVALADDTVCARVKIEIKQELTLERQAFDAHMRINNGLANITLENVKVDVSFADGDGNPVLASSDAANTDALFFIRLDSMENISDVGGTGAVGPLSSADIHWLIIPAPGSSNGLEKGTLYYVGAKLTYTIGGEQKVTEVTPDYIFVKPMPEITLDYFLPADVYGDDAFTPQTIEPPIPFSLGVRVKNSGYGFARKLKIDSVQPKITENEQGLLIGFAIEGSEVNGQPVTDSLLVDFGDISPNSSGMARWIMTCTLSGKFVSFTADFSHSDELGGELTSLIKAVNTHFLVQDVIVDLPGRDAVRDFLANDGSVYRVYESDGVDTQVADQSGFSSLQLNVDTGTLTTPVTSGFMYLKLSDPFDGNKVLTDVIRSDGKVIKSANAWLSHTRVIGNSWQYHLNLFDVNSPGTYTLKFKGAEDVPQPPALQYIDDKTVAEGEQVSFIVEASDPNSTVPRLSAAPLPAGAEFVDEGSGRGVFDWTPAEGQAGVYEIIFSASDGVLGATRRATITVKGFNDTDGDNLDDDWEMKHFGTLARDGSGDYDRDGISDLDEFLNESDPAALADLVIRQTADNINPVVGDPVILTITAINNGPRNATGVQVTDLLSSGFKYISDDAGGSYDPATGVWDIGDLSAAAPDNTAMVNISVEIIHIGEIVNIATLTDADLYDPISSNNSTGRIINGGIQSDLAIEQSVDDSTPDTEDIIAVNIKVTNNGSADATSVQITDVLPGGLTYQSSTASQGAYETASGVWDVGALIFGESAELQLKLMVNTTDEIINTAFISRSDPMDPDPTNNRSSALFNQNLVDHPHVADLAAHKLVNLNAVDVNEHAVFTLVVRNSGLDDAGNIEIDDVLPDGLVFISATPSHGTYDDEDKIWQVGNIPAGSYVLMDMTVDVIAGGEQDNSAIIVSLDEFDPDQGNDSAAKSVTGLAADMAVAQSVDRLTANVGQDFVFTITVTNQGPHDAVGIQVVDEVPPGLIYQSDMASQGVFDPVTGQWDIGELDNGNSATLQITFLVEASGAMINRAVKTASQPTDVNGANDAAAVTVTGNAPPMVGNIPDLTTEEGLSFAAIKLDDYVADDNDDDADIIWSYSGSHQLTVHIDDDRIVSIEVPHMDWNGSETITFTATDPFGMADADEILFTVTAVNDAPVNMVPGGQITAEDTGLVISPSISISDIDANSNALTVMLTAAHGRLTLADRANLTFKIGDGTADAALMFNGTIDAINTALHDMRFDPDADFFGPALLEIQTNDQGHTGAGGSRMDVDTINLTITAVNDPPQAALGGPFSGDEGRAVTFSGSASDIDSAGLSYHWDFEYNGTFVADASDIPLTAPQWTYNDNGTYTVALRVEDEDGGISDIVSGVVTVNNVAPVADAGTDQTVAEGASVEFAANFTDPGADTHTIDWDFGNGSGASGTLTPIHAYADDGIYTVTLTVTDDDGGVGTDTLTVTVYNAAPVAEAGADQTTKEGVTVTFSGSYTDAGPLDTHSVTWDFGDGSPSIAGSLTPPHIYADNGVYTVILTVTDDDGGVGTDTLTVTVDNVVPFVEAGDDQITIEGDQVSFSAGFSDPGADTHTIEWNFGDGTLISGTLTPVHTYGDNSTYTVTLTVTDDDRGAGTDTLSVVVYNAAPEITELTSNHPSNGKIQLNAAFTDQGWLDSHSGQFVFGDSSPAAGVVTKVNQEPDVSGTLTATHIYAVEGSFTVSATVADDDGAISVPVTTAVLIDKTPPVIKIIEPQAGYYHNTDQISVDVAVEDPESSGVSSGLVAESVVVTLNGLFIATDEILDLSGLADGLYTLHVAASDYAGNSAEQEVIFDVGPVPALTHINPHKWDLSWLDPFDNLDDHKSKKTVKAEISLETVEVETILPTDKASKLKAGTRYSDFVVVEVVAAQTGTKPGNEKVVSVTLKYVGDDEIDVLAFSGDAVRNFYDVNKGDIFTVDAGESGHLSRYTVLSSYKSDPPLLSSADIIPQTILLNGRVPIIEGSARLITKDPSALDQSGVIAEPPYTIVKEKRHHVWLTNLGQPQKITLKVGSQTIFADESYPISWQDWFSLSDDGQLQMMRIHVSEKDNLLQVLHHNLQEEARIYLDGALALTILPETKLVVLEVLFNPFDIISTLDRQDIERGGDWLVTTDNGATLKGKHPRKHISVSDIGNPQKVKLLIGDTVIIDDQPFPIKWSERYLVVDGERQDMSIKTHSPSGKNPYLSIHCKKLTREARLYLDDVLVLLISPPPEVEVFITGELELDGNAQTFDGSFRGTDEIELKGKLPTDYDLDKVYQRINTSGEPALEIGDRFGDFEVVNFTEGYHDYRVTDLEFSYDGLSEAEIKVYEDFSRNYLVDSFQAYPGVYFVLDVSHLDVDRVYLEIGNTLADIPLTGEEAAAAGDIFLDCTVFEASRVPVGPPHYMDLTFEYVVSSGSISLTAYDGRWKEVIGIYDVDPNVDPAFTIDGSQLPKGYLGENLVLEYGPAESSE